MNKDENREFHTELYASCHDEDSVRSEDSHRRASLDLQNEKVIDQDIEDGGEHQMQTRIRARKCGLAKVDTAVGTFESSDEEITEVSVRVVETSTDATTDTSLVFRKGQAFRSLVSMENLKRRGCLHVQSSISFVPPHLHRKFRRKMDRIVKRLVGRRTAVRSIDKREYFKAYWKLVSLQHRDEFPLTLILEDGSYPELEDIEDMMERDWAEDSMGQQHVPQEDIHAALSEIVLCMQQRRPTAGLSFHKSLQLLKELLPKLEKSPSVARRKTKNAKFSMRKINKMLREVQQERVKENRRRQSACTMLFPHVADNAWMLTKFKGWEKRGTYVSGSLATEKVRRRQRRRALPEGTRRHRIIYRK